MPDFKPDVSIYGGFKPPAPMSPLEAINTARAGLELQGKSKVGDIYRSAIDPATGEYDPNKVIARAPEAGVLAPEMVTTALQNAHQGIVLDYDKLTATRAAWENMGQLLAAHVDDRDFGADKMTDIIMKFFADPRFGGMIGHATAVKMLQDLRNPATGKPDNAKAQLMARRLISMTMSAHDQTQMYDYYQKSDRTWVRVTKNGVLVDQTEARIGGRPGPAGAIGAPGGPAPAPGSGGPPIGAGGQPLIGAVTSGVPIGEEEAQTQGAKSAIALEGSSAASNEGRAALQNLEQDFAIIKDKMSPYTDREAAANALIRRLSGVGVSMSKEQVMAAESAEKLTNQIIASQGQTMHLTDQAQRTQLGATPRINMSYMGADALTKMALGNWDAIDIKNDEWGKARDADPNMKRSDFHDWSRKFNKNFNPRVFQYQRMNPKQREHIINTMPEGQQAKFLHDYEHAVNQGWIEPERPGGKPARITVQPTGPKP